MTISGTKGPGYLKHISFKLMLTRSFCSCDKQGRLGLKMMEVFYGENEPGIPGAVRNHLSKDSLWTMIPLSSRNMNQNFALCLHPQPWPDVKSKIEANTVSFGWALYQECPCAFVISWFPRSEVTLVFTVSCLSTFQLNPSERAISRVLMPVAMIGVTEHGNYNHESFIHEARCLSSTAKDPVINNITITQSGY